MLALIDMLRQIHGESLGRLGFGPTECRYRIVVTGARWRLRAYTDTSTSRPLLIVTAPIKRPYIWDLAASVSVVRHCLQEHWSQLSLMASPETFYGRDSSTLS